MYAALDYAVLVGVLPPTYKYSSLRYLAFFHFSDFGA
jgi:hypothetical protein